MNIQHSGEGKNELKNYFSSEKIIQDLATQLTKDIGMDEFAIAAPSLSPDTFKEFYLQLFPLIESLHKEHPRKLNYIINRCDISELQLNKELSKTNKKSYPAVLTELIIKRELQKVVIRNLHQKG